MSNLASQVFLDYESAYNAESSGDLTEALRLYRLVFGFMASRKRLEKDGMIIETGELVENLARLERQVEASRGNGKFRAIPVRHVEANCS